MEISFARMTLSPYTANNIELNHPDKGFAYYMRGTAKYILNNSSGACMDWRSAANLGDSDSADLVRKQCN